MKNKNKADRTSVSKRELALLRKLALAADDLFMARNNEKFCADLGGMPVFERALADVFQAWEKEFNTMTINRKEATMNSDKMTNEAPEPIRYPALGIVLEHVPEVRPCSCDGCVAYDIQEMTDIGQACGRAKCREGDGYILRLRPPVLSPEMDEAVRMVLHEADRGLDLCDDAYIAYLARNHQDPHLMLAAVKIAQALLFHRLSITEATNGNV